MGTLGDHNYVVRNSCVVVSLVLGVLGESALGEVRLWRLKMAAILGGIVLSTMPYSWGKDDSIEVVRLIKRGSVEGERVG